MNQWIEGVHYYLNEDGFVVLTEKFHLERGHCCGNGCKNCPFDYQHVPQPKRDKLLKERSLKLKSGQ